MITPHEDEYYRLREIVNRVGSLCSKEVEIIVDTYCMDRKGFPIVVECTRKNWTCSEEGEFTYPLHNDDRIVEFVWMLLMHVEERLHRKLTREVCFDNIPHEDLGLSRWYQGRWRHRFGPRIKD